MQSTARVHNTACIRQRLHEKARASGMIQMNMREKYEVNVRNIEVALFEGVDQERHAVIRSGVNERGPATVDDQVAGILPRPSILSIDGKNAIVKLSHLGAVTAQALLGLRRFETVEAREIFSQKSNVFFRYQCGLGAHHRVSA